MWRTVSYFYAKTLGTTTGSIISALFGIFLVGWGIVSVPFVKKPASTHAEVIGVSGTDSCHKLEITANETSTCPRLNPPDTDRLPSYDITFFVTSADGQEHTFTYSANRYFCTNGYLNSNSCRGNNSPINNTSVSTPTSITLGRQAPPGQFCGSYEMDFTITSVDNQNCTYGTTSSPGGMGLCETGMSCTGSTQTGEPTITPSLPQAPETGQAPFTTPTPTQLESPFNQNNPQVPTTLNPNSTQQTPPSYNYNSQPYQPQPYQNVPPNQPIDQNQSVPNDIPQNIPTDTQNTEPTQLPASNNNCQSISKQNANANCNNNTNTNTNNNTNINQQSQSQSISLSVNTPVNNQYPVETPVTPTPTVAVPPEVLTQVPPTPAPTVMPAPSPTQLPSTGGASIPLVFGCISFIPGAIKLRKISQQINK